MKWMLFRSESSPDYYFWNGVYPVAVSPDTQPWGGDPNNFVELDKATKDVLEDTNERTRKSVFTIGKRRYNVVSRGSFEE